MGKFLKAVVVSDTHGNLESMKNIAHKFNGFDYLFHLGDNVADALWLEREMPRVRVVSVKGNCDAGSTAPEFKEVTLCGKRIILTHGHLLKVKHSYDRALYYAQERDACAILFGHTHAAFRENCGGVWLVNPGSAGDDRHGPLSAAVLMIGEMGVAPKIVPL